MKRTIKWIIIIVALFIIAHFIIDYYFQGIDYRETFRTKYHTADSGQIIETSHFKIQTPINWIHIFQGYGHEGDAGGFFITKHGTINYEYGIFANPFEVDSILVFQKDSMTLNRFTIFIGKNKCNESGIHIPRQHEMELPFSFYMSKSCTENFVDLTNGIKKMEFKKFYNNKWIEEE